MEHLLIDISVILLEEFGKAKGLEVVKHIVDVILCALVYILRLIFSEDRFVTKLYLELAKLLDALK